MVQHLPMLQCLRSYDTLAAAGMLARRPAGCPGPARLQAITAAGMMLQDACSVLPHGAIQLPPRLHAGAPPSPPPALIHLPALLTPPPPPLCRWEVPEDIIPRPLAPTSTPESPLYTVTTGEREGTFRFELHRPDGTLLLNFTTLAFKDQFLYVDAHIPAEASLYGAGESSLTAGLKLPRNGKILTMWNLDIPAASADVDLYGSHPFFLAVMPDGRSHGVFLLNSNGMDMVFRPDSVSYRRAAWP
jgi:hypothetical protein